jgi:hypothetical protein
VSSSACQWCGQEMTFWTHEKNKNTPLKDGIFYICCPWCDRLEVQFKPNPASYPDPNRKE